MSEFKGVVSCKFDICSFKPFRRNVCSGCGTYL